MAKKLIAPSILAADFGRLDEEVGMLNASDADYLHIDIMDGQFVPNISFGFPVCAAIYERAEKPMDFHLMIQNPDDYLESCKKTGADIISVHYEAVPHLHRTIQAIKDLGCKAGVALNPHTSLDLLRDVSDSLDVLLIMSVNPGFGGQSFIDRTFAKVQEAARLREAWGANFMIEVDGGVNLKNAGKLFAEGADMLVAGSSVFSSSNPTETISQLKSS